MENTIEKMLTLFATNTQVIKKEFSWQNSLTRKLAALFYAKEDKLIDCEAIHQCYTIIKQSTGAFSVFRGDMVLFVSALLSLSPDPLRLFEDTLKAFSMMKEAKFRNSYYLAVAAYQIAAQVNSAQYSDVIARTRAFYNGMKSNHFFQTGQDDYIYAVMLGLSDLNVAAGVERVDRIYNRLKGEFSDKNSVQALAQVLVLSSKDDEIVNRVLSLRDVFKARRIKLDKSYTLPSLGILAMLPVEDSILIRDIEEAQVTLRAQKGFGTWSATSIEVLLFATAAVANSYARNIADDVLSAALSTSIANIIIAEQAAMVAIIAASSSAASASASS